MAERIEVYLQEEEAAVTVSEINVIKGDDGGYYKPTVSDDGVLSWTPSEVGMPPIESANIRGVKGDTGDKGDKGDKGDTGSTGATPQMTIGTVTTVEAGTNASASFSGTAENPVLNLAIPRGATGSGSVSSVNGISPDSNGNVDLGEIGGVGIETEVDPTVPAWAKEDNPPTYTAADVGLGNVDNVRQYSASNPPPYPVTSVNGMTGAVTIEVSEFDGDADSLGGVDASVYQAFMTRSAKTVTVNSTFVNSGAITADVKGGVLKVGGYFETKKQHAGDGYSTDIICTIPNVKVSGSTYAVMIDHDHSGKTFNILLMPSGNNSVVQLEPSGYAIAANTWLNFGIFGVIA